jgi:hypothetical protein
MKPPGSYFLRDNFQQVTTYFRQVTAYVQDWLVFNANFLALFQLYRGVLLSRSIIMLLNIITLHDKTIAIEKHKAWWKQTGLTYQNDRDVFVNIY